MAVKGFRARSAVLMVGIAVFMVSELCTKLYRKEEEQRREE